jgi:Ca-activated chloride channel family protein
MKTSKRLAASLAAVITISAGSLAQAKQVDLDVSMSNPLLLAGKKHITYLKVGLTGFELEKPENRAPVNVALVIDKSGSMGGDKIKKAREAALIAVDRLGGDDIISIVAYSDSATVLVPATKVSDRATIRKGINRLEANGSTALFAGVSKGAAEVRKFLKKEMVNRVILISDGQANVGPDSPGEPGDLGASLAKEGISVSTIGLGSGYNEDLMSQLASRSDGNHAFAEASKDLAKIFDHEFGDITSVVAQEVAIHVICARGIRPVRVVGREADISGRNVNLSLNQLYSNQEKYMILEVEVPAGKDGRAQDIASVEVAYANMATHTTDKLKNSVAIRYTESVRVVEEKTNKDTAADAVLQTVTEFNGRARALRQQGKVEEAREMFVTNSYLLKAAASRLKSKKLEGYYESTIRSSINLDDASWTKESKRMTEDMDKNTSQRVW